MTQRILKKKFKTRTVGKDESVIPRGQYCYGITGNTLVRVDAEGNTFADSAGVIQTRRCPYWSRRPDKDYQESGYCAYAEYGDWQHGGFGILWDQVKECGVNMGYEDEEEQLFGIPIELVETV